jgi:hypothetical protein
VSAKQAVTVRANIFSNGGFSVGKVFNTLCKVGADNGFNPLVRDETDHSSTISRYTFLCVDFDGTIVDHRYPKLGKPAPHAIKWLKKLNSCNAKLILYTMRSDYSPEQTYLSDALQYLEFKGIQLFAVNNNPYQESWTSSPKVYADFYIDDAAFGCPLIQPDGFAHPCVDWSKVGPALVNFCLNRQRTAIK